MDELKKPKKSPKPEKTTMTIVISTEAHSRLQRKARKAHTDLHGAGAFADTYILTKLNEDDIAF
jgi:hypothetical protein